MCPTHSRDETFTLMTSNDSPHDDAEEPHDPFNQSYEMCGSSRPPDMRKPDGDGKATLGRGKKKEAPPPLRGEAQAKSKYRRISQKVERVSCKDLRAGGRDSLETRE